MSVLLLMLLLPWLVNSQLQWFQCSSYHMIMMLSSLSFCFVILAASSARVDFVLTMCVISARCKMLVFLQPRSMFSCTAALVVNDMVVTCFENPEKVREFKSVEGKWERVGKCALACGVNVYVNRWTYIAQICRPFISKALSYGWCVTRGSHSFTCHPHTSHTCLYSPAAGRHRPLAGTRLLSHEGMASLSLPGWLVTYQDKCPVPGIEPGHGHPSQY